MATPSFIPKGEKFLATIKRAGVEDVVKDRKGIAPEFDSAAAAVIYARRTIREEDAAYRARHTMVPMEIEVHRKWKLEKAEQLRIEREQFDLRNVQVVVKKRRR